MSRTVATVLVERTGVPEPTEEDGVRVHAVGFTMHLLQPWVRLCLSFKSIVDIFKWINFYEKGEVALFQIMK